MKNLTWLVIAISLLLAPKIASATGTYKKSVIEAVQPVPSVATDTTSTVATVTSPCAVRFGFGTSFADPNVFPAETYPGSGVSDPEPDHMAGFFFNKSGVYGTTIPNIFCYAADDSWELFYKATPGTNGNRWLERNWDFVPSVLRSTVTGGAGFNPAVGSYITFSAGATGKVIAWNSGTGVLDWIHLRGVTAIGETVTGTGGSKTVGAITHIGYNFMNRVFQMEWDTVLNQGGFHLRSVPTAIQPADPFRVSPVVLTGSITHGAVAVNSLSQPNAYLSAETRFPSFAALRGEYISPGSSGNGNALAGAFRVDLSAAAATFESHADVTLLRFDTATQPGAGALAAFAVTRSAAIEIRDQKGYPSTDSAAIRIDPQTVTGAGPAGAQGNVVMRGGNWNNGHIVLGGYGYNTSGDHLFFDQTNDRLRIKLNTPPTSETDGVSVGTVVASGTRALATGAIGAGACSTTDSNITATGAVSTDRVQFSPNADPGLNAGLLAYSAWAGSNVISFRVCNPSAGSITPGAVSMNWAVTR